LVLSSRLALLNSLSDNFPCTKRRQAQPFLSLTEIK